MRKLFWLLAVHLPLFASQTPPKVSVTLAPYAYMVKAIAKEEVQVHILIPENTNPHLYESKPQDIKALAESDIWLQSGEPLEKKLHDKIPATKVDLNQGIDFLHDCSCNHHHDHDKDFHTWLSPKNYLKQAKTVLEILSRTYPDKKKQFEIHFYELEQSLAPWIQKIEHLKTAHTTQKVIVSHGAYAYLCQDLGIKQEVLEYEGKESTLKHIQQVFEEAKKMPSKTLFAPIQHSDMGAKRLGSLLQVPIIYVNPYQENYPQALEEFLKHIE